MSGNVYAEAGADVRRDIAESDRSRHPDAQWEAGGATWTALQQAGVGPVLS